MKTKSEIEDYFIRTLNRQLDDLEAERLLIIQNNSFTSLQKYIAVSAGISLIAYILVSKLFPGLIDINTLIACCILFPVSVAMIRFLILSAKRDKLFRPAVTNYKSKVLGGITTFLNEHFKLNAESGIPQGAFEQTRLFPKAENYHALLLNEGSISGVPASLSLINYFNVTTSKSNDGKRTTTRTTYYFEGAYCILKINTGIRNFVRIRENSYLKSSLSDLFPDKKSNFLVKTLASEILGYSVDSVRVNSGNEEFDNYFDLEAFDEETAKEFINSKLFHAILNFKKQQEWGMCFYLNPSELHIAMNGFNLKGLSVDKPITELLFTQTYINYINDIIGFTEELTKATSAQ